MLTARVAESDRVLGLSSGADDYVCKPFSPREVMARVHALLRRAHGAVMAPQTVWQVDDAALRVTWKGNALPLTTVEFRIFRALMARRGSVCSRSQLIDVSHMDARDVSDRAIDTHVKNIRRKVQSVVPHFKGLESVYGVGYRLEIDD
jgi:two-component system response regulator BaeR